MDAGIEVTCHAGYAYPERPIAFTWQGEVHAVRQVAASWRTPQGKAFRVQADDQRWFELAYNEAQDSWTGKEV